MCYLQTVQRNKVETKYGSTFSTVHPLHMISCNKTVICANINCHLFWKYRMLELYIDTSLPLHKLTSLCNSWWGESFVHKKVFKKPLVFPFVIFFINMRLTLRCMAIVVFYERSWSPTMFCRFFFTQRKDVTLLVISNKNCLKPAAASDGIKAVTKKL